MRNLIMIVKFLSLLSVLNDMQQKKTKYITLQSPLVKAGGSKLSGKWVLIKRFSSILAKVSHTGFKFANHWHFTGSFLLSSKSSALTFLSNLQLSLQHSRNDTFTHTITIYREKLGQKETPFLT